MELSNDYYLTNLKNHPKYEKQAIKLIEESFSYPKNQNYEIDFYPLIGHHNHENNHIIIKKKTDQVVCHIGAILRSLHNNRFHIPILLLGGIATKKENRGEGLFKFLFNNIINKYMNRVSLFILWGGLSDLYKKFNFYEAGKQIEVGNSDVELNDLTCFFEKTKFNKISIQDFDQLKSIYNGPLKKTFTTIARNNNDWHNIKKMTSTDLYLSRDNIGIIDGYFCVGKGADLKGIIHEFCPSPKAKNKLYQILRDYKLWIPQAYNTTENENSKILYLAYFKAGNAKLFSDFISYWSHDEIKINKFDENIVSYNHMNESFIDSMEEFLRKIFGPEPYFDNYNYGPPLYFSGLDSI